jgi:hypothetical protein
MKQGLKSKFAALVLLAIPLLVTPIPLHLIASPAWAEGSSGSSLVVSPTSLDFGFQQGGALPAS